jgi:hypothetical protein
MGTPHDASAAGGCNRDTIRWGYEEDQVMMVVVVLVLVLVLRPSKSSQEALQTNSRRSEAYQRPWRVCTSTTMQIQDIYERHTV